MEQEFSICKECGTEVPVTIGKYRKYVKEYCSRICGKRASTRRCKERDPEGFKKAAAARNKKWYESGGKEVSYKNSKKPKNKAKQKEYRDARKEQKKAYDKEYRKRPEVVKRDKARRKEYYENVWRGRAREIQRERKLNEPLFALKCRLRSMVSEAVANSGFSKVGKTAEYLGCSWEEFELHMRNQFEDGMSWENYGEWQIDHIYPISWCDTPEEIFIYTHYSNFQPLWAIDNNRKGNRWIGKEEPKPH